MIKKSILSIGEVLNKFEQKLITGGDDPGCLTELECGILCDNQGVCGPQDFPFVTGCWVCDYRYVL